ncbi:hypothetical protein LV89_01135 [Arcicella aurantiaca]|uniref:Uncharacterized protein n=1 Tax=Arcicella aurantiaca TaxID=591202 RepID=A0A316ECZ8_9BACT|nr:hypothetical protein [Arcicella aurantiaca]PWK28351.1 hypothetical protein LV89_01135 [Arcicella aurantiaca]
MKNLLTSKKSLAILTACLSLSIFSCKDELSNLDNPLNRGSSSLENVPIEQQDAARIQFAKILAKALENKEVREFVKSESLKMFDNDYDVLYHANKNKLVNGTESFSSVLAKSNNLKEGELDKIVNILPKLNILIPDFFVQSAKTWDTETDIPLVAVSNSELEYKKVDFVRVYDSKANETKLDAHKFPNKVIIVVKNNERIETLNVVKNGRSAIGKEWIPYYKEGDTEFFIAGEGFLNENTKRSNQRKADTGMNGSLPYYGINFWDYTDSPNDGSFGSVLIAHIWKLCPEGILSGSVSSDQNNNIPWVQAMNKGSHRKSIYYNKNGDLNQNVKERMMYCRFTNSASLSNISENWTDGNLEIVCVVAMLRVRPGEDFNQFVISKSVPLYFANAHLVGPNIYYTQEQAKNAGINQGYLTEFTTNGADIYKNVAGIWINWFGEGVTWSPFLYGEQMQYVFYEKDDGAVKTDTYASSTALGSSFGIGIKDVWNIGFTGSSTNSRTLTVTSTNTSDQLGIYVLNYGQDVGFARAPINLGDFQFITQTK